VSQFTTNEPDDGATVGLEVEPTGEDGQDVSADHALGKIVEAMQPAVDGALVVPKEGLVCRATG